ncbi:Outer membrane receptor proteins, mostly Fe transport [Catalinimonas alkaloidigena]|uniref:Outer membrane receptor proteins, mostly Fe transport n=1 Tax=Catalinimonas alkaloidigena TaxID=1075417 RepID=A0A1G9BTY4_9BACT|nr:outer membrane beta-barrel family protein [Catalinimonas alkaloidigena]SDK42634.1 Outer membrane receptor proteins, mostly Fe transport [Catalinimonas alkaloidigena]
MNQIFHFRLSIASCLLVLFSCSAAWAQNKGTGKISGAVIDAADQQPVSLATIALMDLSSDKPVDGTICDDKGEFTLKNIPAGTYKLSISFIGYNTYTKSPVVIEERGTNLDLGKIPLTSETKQLEEVVIEGQKVMIEEKVDRTVYNAENDATTRGGDATDVLRRVPMLSVDMDGNVSLRGSQNIRVLINNRPSTITAGSIADALKQIPADQIKSVEVITSPSARYDAEGTGGIINIITTKTTKTGAQLSINSSVGTRSSNLGVNGSYKPGKMSFSLGGFGRFGYNTPGSFENRQITDPQGESPLLTTQYADTRNRMMFGRYTFGWDYDINPQNYLNGSVQYGLRRFNMFQDGLLSQTFSGPTFADLVSASLRDVNMKDASGTVDVSLNYTHSFKKPQRELYLLTLYSRNDAVNNFVNDVYNNEQSTITSSLKNENNSLNEEITLEADYQTPIGKTQMLETGAKDIIRKVTSDYKYFTADDNGSYVPIADADLSNSFDYLQNIAAAYASYTLSTKNMYSVKGGLRYEYTTIQAQFVGQEPLDIPAYGVLVPSLNLSKKLGNGNMVKAAYNRRIQRPSLQFLNPNIQASNPLNITEGNPELRPEFTNNFELSYSTYLKGLSLNLSTFARNTNNSIQSLRDILGDTVRTTYRNIGRENAFGFSLFANISISNKFSLNGGTDVYYADLRNNVPDPLYNAHNQGWVTSYRLFGNYTIGNGWALQAFSFMRGRQVELQGYRGGFGIYSLSLQKEFAEKRGSIGLGAENFFNFNGFRINSQVTTPVIDQSSTMVMRNMSFKVNFSYRIGKMDQDAGSRRRRRSINNDDLKEGGDGGGMQMGGDSGGGAPAGGAPARGRGPAPTPPAGDKQRPDGSGAAPTPAPAYQSTTDSTQATPQPPVPTQELPAETPTQTPGAAPQTPSGHLDKKD